MVHHPSSWPWPSSSSCSPLLISITFLLAAISVLTCDSSGGLSDGRDDLLMMVERFHGWMAAHGRSYPTAEEKLRRFEIYRDNVEFIEATNRDANLHYSCCDNQFSDLSHQEFLAMYTSRPVALEHGGPVITTRAGEVTEGGGGCTGTGLLLPPESVDWRDKNAVTPVKDQLRGCNACWVFASVATIESAHKIKNPSKRQLISLSEQEIVDCSRRGCGGGSQRDAYQWVIANNGIASESRYGPYTATKGVCREKEVPPSARVYEYRGVTPNCEPALAVAVARQPVDVLFDAEDRGFQCYCSGIYSGPPGGNLDHSMAIIGYGENATTGHKYWIAKNSWGTSWGQRGFVYLLKDLPDNPNGTRGLAINPQFPTVY